MGGNGKRVFVGNLPRGCRERDVERFFRGYGRVVEVLMKKGYCFVEFDDPRDADDAVYDLNGKELMGERLSVEIAKGVPRTFRSDFRGASDRGDRRGFRGTSRRGGSSPMKDRDTRRRDDKYGPPVRTEYRLVVENLSSRVSWQDLKDYMRSAGEVTYADAHKGNKNEGVIEFATFKDMKNAVEKLDDTDLNGRRIRLVEDKGNARRMSRSRSRSRSRRRSRSRSASRSRSRSRSVKRSVSRGRVSRSADRERSKSRSPVKDVKERTRSRSRDRRSRSRSISRGRSRSPGRNGGMDHD